MYTSRQTDQSDEINYYDIDPQGTYRSRDSNSNNMAYDRPETQDLVNHNMRK
jgi:hypothetical protein